MESKAIDYPFHCAPCLSDRLINSFPLPQEALSHGIEKTKLRRRLGWTQAKLDAYQGRYLEAVEEMGLMNRKFEEASARLKEKLASYGIQILNLKKQLSTRD